MEPDWDKRKLVNKTADYRAELDSQLKKQKQRFARLCQGLTTPIGEGWAQSYENPDIILGADRLVHFAQRDHKRIFGKDLRDRIKAAGFALDEMIATEPDMRRYGVMRGETVVIASKPEGAKP